MHSLKHVEEDPSLPFTSSSLLAIREIHFLAAAPLQSLLHHQLAIFSPSVSVFLGGCQLYGLSPPYYSVTLSQLIISAITLFPNKVHSEIPPVMTSTCLFRRHNSIHNTLKFLKTSCQSKQMEIYLKSSILITFLS